MSLTVPKKIMPSKVQSEIGVIFNWMISHRPQYRVTEYLRACCVCCDTSMLPATCYLAQSKMPLYNDAEVILAAIYSQFARSRFTSW